MNVDLIGVVAQDARHQRQRIQKILPTRVGQILYDFVIYQILRRNRIDVDRFRASDDIDFFFYRF